MALLLSSLLKTPTTTLLLRGQECTVRTLPSVDDRAIERILPEPQVKVSAEDPSDAEKVAQRERERPAHAERVARCMVERRWLRAAAMAGLSLDGGLAYQRDMTTEQARELVQALREVMSDIEVYAIEQAAERLYHEVTGNELRRIGGGGEMGNSSGPVELGPQTLRRLEAMLATVSGCVRPCKELTPSPPPTDSSAPVSG